MQLAQQMFHKEQTLSLEKLYQMIIQEQQLGWKPAQAC
jgi:hypothetical protein